MFYDVNAFPQLNVFELYFDEIKKELLDILHKPMGSPNESTWMQERPGLVDTKTRGWKSFTFRFFGINHLPNQEACPIISKIINEVPGIITAEFSLLSADTHILPHRGYPADFLRSHLGLVVPKGDLGIKTDTHSYTWEEGKIMVFDDGERHEAWNFTSEDRIVLMFDFVPSFNNADAKHLCRDILERTDDKFILSMGSREEWLKCLEVGYFPTELKK